MCIFPHFARCYRTASAELSLSHGSPGLSTGNAPSKYPFSSLKNSPNFAPLANPLPVLYYRHAVGTRKSPLSGLLLNADIVSLHVAFVVGTRKSPFWGLLPGLDRVS